jgi:8-oxo-dGTP diphosphatase
MIKTLSMETQKQTIILTNMIMLYRNDGSFLVENRLKNDWPGITFPGGHVEIGESLLNSAIRESREETGLSVQCLEQCGYFEWNLPEQNIRHLAILFRSNIFSGKYVLRAKAIFCGCKEKTCRIIAFQPTLTNFWI